MWRKVFVVRPRDIYCLVWLFGFVVIMCVMAVMGADRFGIAVAGLLNWLFAVATAVVKHLQF